LELKNDNETLLKKVKEFDNVKASFANNLESLNGKIHDLHLKNTGFERKIQEQHISNSKIKSQCMTDFNVKMKKSENDYKLRLVDANREYDELKKKYENSITKRVNNEKLVEKLYKKTQEVNDMKESCTKHNSVLKYELEENKKQNIKKSGEVIEGLTVDHELSIKKLKHEIELLNLKIKSTQNNLKEEREFMTIYKQTAEDAIIQQQTLRKELMDKL